MIVVRNLTNLVRNTISKWSNIDPKWENAPLGGASRRRGVYLVSKFYIWSLRGCISYQVRQISYLSRQTSYPLRTNSWEEIDGQGPHDIPHNYFPVPGS